MAESGPHQERGTYVISRRHLSAGQQTLLVTRWPQYQRPSRCACGREDAQACVAWHRASAPGGRRWNIMNMVIGRLGEMDAHLTP